MSDETYDPEQEYLEKQFKPAPKPVSPAPEPAGQPDRLVMPPVTSLDQALALGRPTEAKVYPGHRELLDCILVNQADEKFCAQLLANSEAAAVAKAKRKATEGENPYVERLTIDADGKIEPNQLGAYVLFEDYAFLHQATAEMRAELAAWRTDGVTEEILRRHDGYIKVGEGCRIVSEKQDSELRSQDRFKTCREAI